MKQKNYTAGHTRHLFWKAFWVLVIALVAFRLYLPTLVTQHVNTVLAKIPGYRGHIRGVDIHLWRGAYSINRLKLLKINGEVPVPFLEIDSIDLSVEWRALWHRSLVASIDFNHPVINFVTGPSKEQQQTSVDKSIGDRLKELVPLRINHIGVHEGEIHFRNYEKDPHVDIYLHGVELIARNLTNSAKLSKTLSATVEGHGRAMDSGHFTVRLVADPYSAKPTFDSAFELKDLDLKEVNAFLARYAAIEAKDGVLGVYSEVAAKDGIAVGYAKPVIDHLNIIQLKEERKSFGEVIKGTVAKVAIKILENKDRVGSRVDFSGDLDDPEVFTFTGVASLLRNMLIRPIHPGLDKDITPATAVAAKKQHDKDSKK